MKMKVLTTILFFMVSFVILFSQNNKNLFYEQTAISFFSDSIAKNIKHTKIYFDGKIQNVQIDSVNKELDIVHWFYIRKRSNSKDSNQNNYYSQQIGLVLNELQKDTTTVWNDSIDYNKVNLKYKNPIHKRKKLKYHSLSKNPFECTCKKIKNKIFSIPYNLKITRAVLYNKFRYVKIELNELDFETGKEYILKINNDGVVVDYSYDYWIQ